MKKNLIILLSLLFALYSCVILFVPFKVVGIAVFAAVMAAMLLVYLKNIQALKQRITKLSNELKVASSRITSVSNEIGITIEENNSHSNELFRQTREMSSLTSDMNGKLSETINKIKGMIDLSDETRQTILGMENVSKKSSETISGSMTEIMHIVDTIKEIKTTSSRASDSIEKLKSESDSILTIVEKITEISMQMHIIAINASVEAAKAGQFGKSFTVVADEFKKLSSVTDSSVKEISELILSIQKEVLKVYNEVRENSARVDDGVRLTKAIEDNLRNINASFSDVLKMVEHINNISQTEHRLAGEMNDHLDRVEDMITRTGEKVSCVYDYTAKQKEGIENIAEMGLKLESASSDLLSIVGNEAEQGAEQPDEQTKRICLDFFPVIEKELCRELKLIPRNYAAHSELLNRLKEKHKILEAVWTNEKNGRFICSIPKAGIANAAHRDWFRESIKGEKYISSIYISGITKNKCVTLSMPFFNDRNEIEGVVGVDMNLSLIKENKK